MDEWRYDAAHDHGLTPADRLRSLRRESGLTSSIARIGWGTSVRAYLRIWHRLSVKGRVHLPAAPPFIMVSNHTSHLDTLSLAAALPLRLRDQVLPLAAGDTFFETPVLAAFAAGVMNALPLWRAHAGRHALNDLRRRLLDEPCAYILFPEGTRSRDGAMGPFKSGLGMLVAETTVPVIPCFLDGAFAALPPRKHLPRPKKLRLQIGAPMRFDHVENCRAGWNTVATEMRSAVERLEPGRSKS
jgi:1-acyl-sn-glycerol-3-phosphate acyltransferase